MERYRVTRKLFDIKEQRVLSYKIIKEYLSKLKYDAMENKKIKITYAMENKKIKITYAMEKYDNGKWVDL